MIILFIISILFNIILLTIIIVNSINQTLVVKSIQKKNSDNEKQKIDGEQNQAITCPTPKVGTTDLQSPVIDELLINEIKNLVLEFNQKPDTIKFCENILSKTATEFSASQGAFYITHTNKDSKTLRFVAGYAFYLPDSKPIEFEFGEGLVGQVAKDGKILNIDSVPFEQAPVFSGLGKSVPNYLIICPIVKKNNTLGVMEFSSFKPFTTENEIILNKITELIGDTFNQQEV